MTIPGIGPICAMAIQAFAPPMESFRRGRDCRRLARARAAPCTRLAVKPRLGRISKMGQRDLRRLLITGAMAVVRWASRRGEDEGPVAGPDADAQAQEAGRRRAGQPDGAHRLGADDEQRGLPGSRRSSMSGRGHARDRRGCGQDKGRRKGKWSTRRDRKTSRDRRALDRHRARTGVRVLGGRGLPSTLLREDGTAAPRLRPLAAGAGLPLSVTPAEAGVQSLPPDAIRRPRAGCRTVWIPVLRFRGGQASWEDVPGGGLPLPVTPAKAGVQNLPRTRSGGGEPPRVLDGLDSRFRGNDGRGRR